MSSTSAPDLSARRGGSLVGAVGRAMARAFGRIMAEEGLADVGPGEGRLVYLLWKDGPARQKSLARRAGIDKSTLALTLARMEAKGMVTRGPDPTDGRAVAVSLSPAMAERAPAFERASARMNALFYGGIPDAEIDAFEATLARVLANLEA